ncbi:DUF1707 SHOCT-like domain-containing protein [Haloechinothrix salitolerans]|uniref:DUF1707 domain-containing protein n=1 Tax=Haloechinothrix salitolerans TaxID=926830 RepID=A0ABW2C777_9PSEU
MRATLRAVSQDQPDEARPPALRASDADRERVAGVLHRALSEGRITMTELEERLGAVYAAKTHADLVPLTSDLPESTGAAPVPAAQSAVGHPLIGGTPGSTSSIAVMSGAARRGNWCVPAQHNSFAFWGGVDIDLRQATFAEQHVTITAVAIMGGIDIVVPDDIRVEVTGVGFMGGFDSTGDAQPNPDPNGPVVTVNGLAFWGGVSVKRKPRTPPPDKHRMI